MPARIIQNGGKGQTKTPRVQIKAPEIKQSSQIQEEMKAAIAQKQEVKNVTTMDRAQFYAGVDRINLRGNCVQRVRVLQEENDHLQREIAAKEKEIAQTTDPLAILADVEHRRILIARNTGEILKIYTRNEERIKRIKDLESQNAQIEKEMMEMQGSFVSTKDMDEKTKYASEFFIFKAQIEKNLEEINELSK